jgi:hypothetical protein
MKRIRKKESSHILGVLGLLVTVTGLILGYWYFAETSARYQRARAIQYQPRLILLGAPHIKSVRAKPEPISLQDSPRWAETPGPTIPELFLKEDSLWISSQLTLKNTGNALAKVYASIWTDTISFTPNIRDNLLRLIRDADTTSLRPMDKLIELLPGDSTTLTCEQSISFLDSGKFTIHYLILYENEFGDMYDTYVWSPFKIHDYIMQLKFDTVDTKQVAILTYQKMKAGDLVTPIGVANVSYRTYEQSDADEIRRCMRETKSRLNR